MALWHIPIFHGRNPLDTVFDDIFDWSFSPKCYRQIYVPYNKFHNKTAARHGDSQGDSFKISLGVRDYKPEEISLKVDGEKLLVKGKRHRETEFGSENSEFERTYPVPSDVDKESFKSKINDDGVLEIEASKVKQDANQAAVEPLQEDEKRFKAVLDMTDYKPEDVSVKVQGKRVIVHGEQKSKSKDDDKDVFVHHRHFTRQFLLPDTVDFDTLQSTWTKDGKLLIEADKHPSLGAEGRQLEIEHESSDEGKNED